MLHSINSIADSCSMLHNGLISMLCSKHNEGCCYTATFNSMGKRLPGVQILLQCSRQDPIDHFFWLNYLASESE